LAWHCVGGHFIGGAWKGCFKGIAKESGFTNHTYKANEKLADMVLLEIEKKVALEI
jgi:hypothetical protein